MPEVLDLDAPERDDALTPKPEQAALSDPEVISLVEDKLQELRKRLLDSSRRNPLININFRPNSASVIRVVDELPDILRYNLASGAAMRLAPLPAFEDELPDEQTVRFQETLFLATREDEGYLEAINQLDTSAKDAPEKELMIERALKDRVREKLGLPPRQTKDELSLTKHAQSHGISPNYILPTLNDEHEDGRHHDTYIQTLMLPDRLSRTAKNILERGRSFERETGVNVLHAAFGILEWKSPGEQDKFTSPLLLLEIRIERKQSPVGAEFYINGVDKVFVNTTLAQKLLSEHRLDMPDYETGSVEDYFEEIVGTEPKGWHWKVRREAALGIFPSSKIAMYHDLDPTRRPLAVNQVIGRMLATSGTGGIGYAGEYSTDDPKIVRKVPHLVMDADASQFSSLVDIADGKNLALEGPPGSGKSQTIVNMISAALEDGKKILFVAEKLTALDVVKNRLESVGLGEFLLPLQAGRSSREKVYESLEERLYLSKDGEHHRLDFERRQISLEQRRMILQNYLDALGSNFGTTGMTVYETIGHGIATTDIRDEIPKEVRRIRLTGSETLGPEHIDAVVSDTKTFAEHLSRLGQMPKLWISTRAMILNRDDAEDTCEFAGQIADRIEVFADEIRASRLVPLLADNVFDTDMAATTTLLHAIASGTGRSDHDLVEKLTDTGHRSLVLDLCRQIEERQRGSAPLTRLLRDPEGRNIEARIKAAREFGKKSGGGISPKWHMDRLAALQEDLNQKTVLLSTTEVLPHDWKVREVLLSRIQSTARELLAFPDAVKSLRLRPPEDGLEALAENISTRVKDLNAELARLRNRMPNAGMHKAEEMEATANAIENSGVLRFLSRAFKAARNTYTNILGGRKSEDRASMVKQLRDYAAYIRMVEEFETDGCLKTAFGNLFTGLRTDIGMTRKAVEFYRIITEASADHPDLRTTLETGDLTTLKPIAASEDAPDITVPGLKQQIDALQRKIETERSSLEEARTHIALFNDLTEITTDEIAEIEACKLRDVELVKLIERSPAGTVLGERFKGVATDTGTLVVECSLAETLAGAIDPAIAISILRSGDAKDMVREAKAFSERLGEIDTEIVDFCKQLKLPDDLHTSAALYERIADLRAAAANAPALMARARLRRAEDVLRRYGFDLLVDWTIAEGANINPERLGPIVRSIIAKNMADRAYEIHGDALQGYSGEDFDRIRAEIVEKDRQLIKISREVIRHGLVMRDDPPFGNSVGRKSSYTEMSLIINEMNKKRNRVGVRELTRRSGQALLELKPCWMMSPLAVSQYLHDGICFDLVVIDEASQMTPENAIGAISRAKQAVIVGDTKQLPPTSFFQKMFDDSDTDEDIREDSESVLDMANVAFMPVRQLRWHYRSRHSGLIQFSNAWMYDKKLTIFPSAHEDHPDLGVTLVQTKGLYKARTNEIEARAVVQAAVLFMSETPNLSLGICTMNTDQKELILEEFEFERDRNPKVQNYVRRWEEKNDALEEFFVKNLETIQGDERDVMFISTLYGPEVPEARVHQRFGPINSVHGHRRLNVLFTRAKRKIVTFTSMVPSDILVDEAKNKGVKMFRGWFEYCATGHVPDTGGARGGTDSPFEGYVIRQIESLGCEAVPQVGAAGYRIDIGVRHPDWPHGYILGVECDGATYHSSKSSRDRDRLRQEVLEGLGWKLHRIWSTDWFNDPRSERAVMKEAIETRIKILKMEESERSTLSYTKSGPAAPTREERAASVQPPQRARQESLPMVPSREDLFVRAEERDANDAVGETFVAAPGETNKRDTDPIIGVGSKVTIERLDNTGRRLSFTISDKKNDPNNGILGLHTPLGEALIDCQGGDEVEYRAGSYIHTVRILVVH